MSVITRFAPSPTGKLHIGGARTALFNFLFAKNNSGKFLIRIENTDRNRSTEENIKSIINSINWLNLKPSNDFTYQTENFDRHREMAFKLLNDGFAYKCYLTTEELDELRKKSRSIGVPIKSPYRETKNSIKFKSNFVIRLKMPLNGETTIFDQVQGKVNVRNEILDDMVLLRNDQTPTYMLASVVDDYLSKVSHIIRGDDHFNNSFRQIQIIKYLQWPQPIYAHIPLIHGNDGTKLSKRHGAKNLLEYEKIGYEPICLNNYLFRLGYSINNDKIYNFETDKVDFQLNKINKAPSRFDEKKLINVNSNYLKKSSPTLILSKILKKYQLNDNDDIKKISNLLPDLLKRYKTLNEIEDDLDWLTGKHKIKDKNILLQLSLEKNKVILKEIVNLLISCEWEINIIKTCINNYLNNTNRQMSDVAPIIRMAITGKTNAPDIVNILFHLGKKECLNRLQA